VQTWDGGEPGRVWTPPTCTGWKSSGFTSLVVVVARFRRAGEVQGLLRRVGSISEYLGICYWSTTRKQWRTLILDAYALQGPVGETRRKDFTSAEMTKGKNLFFQQEDNMFGKAIYRMRVVDVSADRLVFETENAATMRKLGLPLFRPGEIRSIHFLDRESQDVWRYYGITRTSRSANPLTAGHGGSWANRAVAYYRYLAGIPTDRDPPASP